MCEVRQLDSKWMEGNFYEVDYSWAAKNLTKDEYFRKYQVFNSHALGAFLLCHSFSTLPAHTEIYMYNELVGEGLVIC